MIKKTIIISALFVSSIQTAGLWNLPAHSDPYVQSSSAASASQGDAKQAAEAEIISQEEASKIFPMLSQLFDELNPLKIAALPTVEPSIGHTLQSKHDLVTAAMLMAPACKELLQQKAAHPFLHKVETAARDMDAKLRHASKKDLDKLLSLDATTMKKLETLLTSEDFRQVHAIIQKDQRFAMLAKFYQQKTEQQAATMMREGPEIVAQAFDGLKAALKKGQSDLMAQLVEENAKLRAALAASQSSASLTGPEAAARASSAASAGDRAEDLS